MQPVISICSIALKYVAFLFLKKFTDICCALLHPLPGEYDHLPEQAFYMVGPIEEAVAKAEKLAEEHS